MFYPGNVITTVIKRLKECAAFARTVIINEFDSKTLEKPNEKIFISVGLDSYYIGENIETPGGSPETREFTANVRISCYGRYANGADNCYKYTDRIIQMMFEDFKDIEVKGVKCSGAEYRRKIDSIAIDSVFELNGLYHV